MSEENLEITRRAYEAFNRRDFETLDALWDPNIEWHQFTQFPDRGVYRGVEEVRDRFLKTQLVEQFGDFRIDIEELVDAGDHVVVFFTSPVAPWTYLAVMVLPWTPWYSCIRSQPSQAL